MRFPTHELMAVVDSVMRVNATLCISKAADQHGLEIHGMDNNWHVFMHVVLKGDVTKHDRLSESTLTVMIDSKILKDRLRGVREAELNLLLNENGIMRVKTKKNSIVLKSPESHNDLSGIHDIRPKVEMLRPMFCIDMKYDQRLSLPRLMKSMVDGASGLVRFKFSASAVTVFNSDTITKLDGDVSCMDESVSGSKYTCEYSKTWLESIFGFKARVGMTMVCHHDIPDNNGGWRKGSLAVMFSSDCFDCMYILLPGNSTSRPVAPPQRRLHKQMHEIEKMTKAENRDAEMKRVKRRMAEEAATDANARKKHKNKNKDE